MYILLLDLYILFSISIVYTYIYCINKMVPAFVFLSWGLGTVKRYYSNITIPGDRLEECPCDINSNIYSYNLCERQVSVLQMHAPLTLHYYHYKFASKYLFLHHYTSFTQFCSVLYVTHPGSFVAQCNLCLHRLNKVL